jgi:hypothetical protein
MEMALRLRFAGLARDPKRRCVGAIDRPARWYPERVPDESGFGMTDPAAWELLATRLEDSTQTLESVILDKPPGAIGYAMKISLAHLSSRVYAKFEFIVVAGNNAICGRSFHLENPR